VLRGGWFHTGDIASIDTAGVMRLIGRKKSEINRAGIKVHPEELDSLLERHPEVIEACTFGMPDKISGETVAAAVRLAPESNLNSEALRRWTLERIRRENVPERWFFLDEIPKSERGKINRQAVMTQCMKLAQDQ
jgi:acyl-coenzyme A synthetase/AMP-(fatty) acid ligase